MESSEEINIRDKCALCKTLDCCPEHCCNVNYFATTLQCLIINVFSGINANAMTVNIAEGINTN